MARNTFVKICRLGLASAILVLFSQSPAQAQEYVEGEVIVKLKNHQDKGRAYGFIGKAMAQKGLSLKRSWDVMGLHHMKGRAGKKTKDLIAELKNDPDVEFVEPNYIFKKASVPNSTVEAAGGEMSGFNTSQSASAMAAATGLNDFWMSATPFSGALSSRPIVAVIDSGLDTDHPMFVNSNAIWTNPGEIAGNGVDDDHNGYVDDIYGWNFVSDTNDVSDDEGHGTHVSGIILNVDQDVCNESSAVGTTSYVNIQGGLSNSRIQIMPLKFLDAQGSGATSDAIEAIYYAVNNGAAVLNNSWGGPTESAALHAAIAYSYEAGALFVAAAGNAGTNNDSSPLYPASYQVPNIISVAATTSSDGLAAFSNYGILSVDLGSPGSMIYSAVPGNYCGTMSGTSMAAPMVAGVAAQMEVENPALRGYQIRKMLFADAQQVSALSGKVYTESRIEVNSAVLDAKAANPDASDEPSYNVDFSSDRELASAVAGGGCGTVAKIYRDGRGSGSGGQGLGTWYILIVVGLLVLPMILAHQLGRDPQQKRRFDRFQISSDVRMKVGDRELVGSVSSISLGGVQVNTAALLENGGLVSMQISSPDGKEQVQVEGRIVWSEANKAYGVAFQEATYTTLERISHWTKKLQKAS